MSTVQHLDIATALDLTLEDEQEAKFMALRALHGKKIKQLMISIDSKEKEIAKLKVLSKDSRRSQMIQALRGKIKDMETIQDIVKEEFAKKAQMTVEDVNDFIIRKTTGGPKRFRPLTREEMENKIIELEKRANSGSRAKSAGNVDGGRSVTSQARSIQNTRDALTNIRNGPNTNQAENSNSKSATSLLSRESSTGNNNKKDDGLSKVAQLMSEINGLRNALDVAQGALELQKEEVNRLRQRNSTMAAADEEYNFISIKNRELVLSKKALEEEICLVSRNQATMQEELILHRSSAGLELEQNSLAMDQLQQHCEKLLRQNSSLLHKLGDMETELENAEDKQHREDDAGNQTQYSQNAHKRDIEEANKRNARLTDKLNMQVSLCTELQVDNQQITSLREQLRTKNNQIRELARQVESLGAVPTVIGSATNSPVRTTTSAAGAGGSPGNSNMGQNMGNRGRQGQGKADNNEEGALRAKVSTLMSENKQLKEALLAAAGKANSPCPQKTDSMAGQGQGSGSMLEQEMLSIKLKSANEESERLQDNKEVQNEVKDKETQILGLRAQLRESRDATPISSPRDRSNTNNTTTTTNNNSNKGQGTPQRSPKADVETTDVDHSSPSSSSNLNLQMDSKDAGELFSTCNEATSLLTGILQHYFSIFEHALQKDDEHNDHKLVKKLVHHSPVPERLVDEAESYVKAMRVLEKNKTFASLFMGSKYSTAGDTTKTNAVALTASLVKVKKHVVYLVELVEKVHRNTLLLSPRHNHNNHNNHNKDKDKDRDRDRDNEMSSPSSIGSGKKG